jgi:hypothetical protein
MFHERTQTDEALFNRLCPADKQVCTRARGGGGWLGREGWLTQATPE